MVVECHFVEKNFVNVLFYPPQVENSMLQKALDNVEENNEKLRDANSAMKEKLQTLNGSSNNSTACASSLSSTSSPDQQA